jgi:hypothetical protein
MGAFLALLLCGVATAAAGTATDELRALMLLSGLVLSGTPTAHATVGANFILPVLLLVLLPPVLLLSPVLLRRGNVLVLRLGCVTSALPAGQTSATPTM